VRYGSGLSLPDLMQAGFGFRLQASGHLVEHIARLVDPAALLACLCEDLAQSGPEAERSVTHRQLGCQGQPPLLQIEEQFPPAPDRATAAPTRCAASGWARGTAASA